MKSPSLSTFTLTALLAVVMSWVTGVGQSPQPTLPMLSEVDYEACGLHKLDDQEQANLLHLVRGWFGRSYLQPSAVRFLEADDWEPVDVLGPVPPDSADISHRERVLAIRGYRVVTLDPPLSANPLLPGRYWVKGAGQAWTIMFPDGDTGLYWVASER